MIRRLPLAWVLLSLRSGAAIAVGGPAPPTTSTSSTTTLPGVDHPQSGEGLAFLEYSNATGTCAYLQATKESQLRIEGTLLPPKYCLPNPVGFGCLLEQQQFKLAWYDSSGSQVFGTSYSPVYVG